MLELTVVNPLLEVILPLDDYYSLVWTERHADLGDFVLELPISYLNHPNLVPGMFLTHPHTRRLMMIQDVNPQDDPISGSKLVLLGDSAEVILKSRVTTYILNVQNALIEEVVLNLLNESIIEPFKDVRRISNFEYLPTTDPGFQSTFAVTEQYEPDTLYSIIRSMCSAYDLGFKVEWAHRYKIIEPGLEEYERVFEFSLVNGVDRSYRQSDVPRVIFSKDYDNVESSSYYMATKNTSNVHIIVTEEPEQLLQVVEVETSANQAMGIDRVESVSTATEIDRVIEDPDGGPSTTMEWWDVFNIFYRRGEEALWNSRSMTAFEGEIHIDGVFKYEEDFFMGDLVQCILNGVDTVARVVELTRTIDSSGITNHISLYFVEPEDDGGGS